MRSIRKGDTVEVISGDERGARGTVREVLPKKNRVIVSGINIIKQHVRPRPTGGRLSTQAGIIEREAPIHLSNVMLVCPSCNRRTRVAYNILDDGSKVRICKRCDTAID